MYCAQCGAQAVENARFCVNCGASLAPTASRAEHELLTSNSRRRTRPGWVWVSGAFYLLSAGSLFLYFALISADLIELDAAQQAYFASFDVVDFIGSIGVVLIALWANVLLFRLRRTAVRAFELAFSLSIAMVFVNLLTRNWVQALGGWDLAAVLLGWAALICVVLYARRLERRGVLT